MTTLALVVEDGTGLATANTYVSVADADDIHRQRLHSEVWLEDYDLPTKQKALVQATFVLDQLRWKGNEANPQTQALRWPRVDVEYVERTYTLADDALPEWLEYVTAVLAFRLVETDLLKLVDEQRITSKSTGKGSITLGPKDRQWLAVLPTECRMIVQPYVIEGSARLVRV